MVRSLATVAACALLTGSLASAQDAVPQDGLLLWLDAAQLTVGDEPIAIEEWPDCSGRENHFTQPNEAHQPQIVPDGIGGRPAVRFDGAAALERMEFSGLEPGDREFHIIVVMRGRESPPLTAQRVLDIQSRAPGADAPTERRGFWVGFQQSRNIPRLGIANGDEGEALTPVWDDAGHMLEFVYTGQQSFEIYIDGRRERRAMFGGTHFLGFEREVSLALGQHARGVGNDSTWFHGDLAEVLIYNRPLTVPERAALGLQFTQEYSLNTTFQELPLFERDVAPLLAARCWSCHGEETQEAGLDLRTVSAMLRGGEAGPVVIRGHPELSELLAQVESGDMPPDEEPLSAEQQELLRNWIAADAAAEEKVELTRPPSRITDEDREHWAYQKLQERTPPEVDHVGRVRNDIDRFILARLEAEGLGFSPDASPDHFVRRVYFDLTGLPPSPEEIDDYLRDAIGERDARLIDRLLDSQHFGERWGRHWLDVVGFVDVYGSDNDAAIIKNSPGKWQYRDYVIESFNADKPFDQFLTEQLAGDELYDWRNADRFTPEMREALIATTFLLSANDDTAENELNTPDVRHHVLQRTAENVAGSLLAFTLQCAKCHDHKYEAISQHDYYRFEAVFAHVFNMRDWTTAQNRHRPDVPDAVRDRIDARNAEIDTRLNEIAASETKIRSGVRDQLVTAKLENLPDDVRDSVRVAIEAAEDQRDETQKQLVAQYGPGLAVTDEEVAAALSPEQQKQLSTLSTERMELTADRPSYGTIGFATESSMPVSTHVLRRGDYLRPGLEVDPELFEVLSPRQGAPVTLQDQTEHGTSGRRLALARALTDPQTPAGAHTARVFVNRVWQQLTGRGIVKTSDNFGASGSPPTHPELLDWLTQRFIEGGWRVKPLIRRIMLSTAYRQTSVVGEESARAAEVDPENRLLWRMNLRRLDSEQVRDAILVVSGKLDRTMGGPPIPLDPRADGMVVIKSDALPTPTSQWRRTVYVLARRNYHMTLMRVFDQPIVARNCAYRQPSAVVTQSLALLNDEFVNQQAAFLAERVLNSDADTSPAQQILTAWKIVLGRTPDAEESNWAAELLKRHHETFAEAGAEAPQREALTQLCHMLLNSSEFLYVP